MRGKLENINTREWPPGDMLNLAKDWRNTTKILAGSWSITAPEDRFAILQQVSSAVRTVLSADLESRIR